MFHFSKPIRKASLFGALSMSLILTACGNNDEISQWDEIQEEGTLTVATSGTLFPTSFHSDETEELTGFEVEVAREVAARLDLNIEFTEMGFDGMLTSINNNQVDFAVNDIDMNESREEDFLFSDPYKFSYGSMVVREDDYSGIETLDDLASKRAGGAATSIYMQISEEFGAEAVTYDNVTNDTYLLDVENGRTDVVLNDYYLQTMAVEALPEIDVTVHPDLFYHPNNQGIIMKKENVELQENVNQVIQEMLEDGTITELSEQFFAGQDVSQEPDIDFAAEE